ncbi:hypothetical protein COV49_01955 [Candidatus Falkowbacteria bacterium CG11_big_fil_rev_8_21_14_0_20_39_10]|uniref:Glycosyl transferase family 1 n=1 Tax=Candidatus Falkowbacteria bacterium CG11_big_fil_rev_8_21_14_0_20_39_10 TaxID=1974570 RepID=A0A2M6K9G6_9BACT|nr:MAG: hypothetical protein COV49_01955 [Candidatus Falkowbacteria bacterium CG11_big_fil_rev_8_21_14_0_20_39_10]
MNTLLFTLEYPPFRGGVASYYGNLVKYWPTFAKASAGKPTEKNEIFVLNNNDGKLLAGRLPILKWLPAFGALWQEVKSKKINHVLVGNILPLGTVTLVMSKILKFKYAVFIHGTDIAYAQKQTRKRWLAKIILKNADKVICNSRYTAGLVEKFIGDRDKVCVVNPGVDPTLTLPLRRRGNYAKNYNLDNKIILFTICRLIKRKGVDKAIEVMPEVLKSFPNLVYVVAGGGPDEGYLKTSPPAPFLIKRGELVFLGKITDEEKWTWLDLCDIFIMPTREEDGNFDGFGIVYLEANLSGKPVIAGRSGGVAEAVEDGVSGLLVDPNDAEEIKNAIIKLARDENLRKELGEQGRERAIKNFNWEKQVRKIYDLIK